jgi:hypothetical protein
MVREVKGFVTSDGRFFDHKAEAELAEAKLDLLEAMQENSISIDALEWIDNLAKPLTKYLLCRDSNYAATKSFNAKPSNTILNTPKR